MAIPEIALSVLQRIAESKLNVIRNIYIKSQGVKLITGTRLRSLFNLPSLNAGFQLLDLAIDFAQTPQGQFILGNTAELPLDDIPVNSGISDPFGRDRRLRYTITFGNGDAWTTDTIWSDSVLTDEDIAEIVGTHFEGGGGGLSPKARTRFANVDPSDIQIVVVKVERRF